MNLGSLTTSFHFHSRITSYCLFWLLLFQSVLCAPSKSNSHETDRTIRQYYIAAEEELWDYAPMQWNKIHDRPLTQRPAALYTAHRDNKRIGSVYQKVFYRQYTDATFTVPIAHDKALGVLGPILRAEAGDQIHILFQNRASYPHSLHPYVSTGKQQKQSHPLPGQAVQPNDTYHYVWDIPSSYPFPENQSSVIWAYSSSPTSPGDVHAGLLGFVVVYRSGMLGYPSPGAMFQRPQGIDQEIFMLMSTTDENKSTYFKQSGERAGLTLERMETLAKTDRFFNESNRMYHINGYVYNNNPVINLVYGSRVRWYVVSFEEDEVTEGDHDVHTAHWHGASLLYQGRRVDVVDLMPISFEVVDMVPDNAGQWLFHCHVAAHFDAGMSAFYQVEEVVYTGDEGWD